MAVTNFVWDVDSDSYLMETDGSGQTQAVYTYDLRRPKTGNLPRAATSAKPLSL